MSNETTRVEGNVEKLGGKIKQGFGKLVGNERLQAEGLSKQFTGEAKIRAAKAAERVLGRAEQFIGAVKNRLGAVIANDELQVTGKATELKGEARQRANS